MQLIIARTIWKQFFSNRSDPWNEIFTVLRAWLVDPGPFWDIFYSVAIDAIIWKLVIVSSRSTFSGAMSTFVAIIWPQIHLNAAQLWQSTFLTIFTNESFVTMAPKGVVLVIRGTGTSVLTRHGRTGRLK